MKINWLDHKFHSNISLQQQIFNQFEAKNQ